MLTRKAVLCPNRPGLHHTWNCVREASLDFAAWPSPFFISIHICSMGRKFTAGAASQTKCGKRRILVTLFSPQVSLSKKLRPNTFFNVCYSQSLRCIWLCQFLALILLCPAGYPNMWVLIGLKRVPIFHCQLTRIMVGGSTKYFNSISAHKLV